MVSIDYLEKVILPLIKKDCSEKFVNDFACALGYYKSHNYEAFDYGHPEYDGRPDAFLEDSFGDIISSTTIVDENGNFGIAPGLDDGELSEAISDDTGYCVSSIIYSLIVEGM